ncbi:hypothetical protein ACOQFV_24430 [Nocardiopsis changdeensis]|uniref:Uncharacterized protein n=1 Tax=Nocardiopsis changdeensis TaxID=2831969 RepID=A0A975KTZ9_9ACTN|nr:MULTISPECIES: hypothetical protein [Nocardiopsis]QUX26462.1 hypothetical protein KGD84_32710 [Nocardiopsis changdeensis]QYX40734.1 hypothetical protein K1J57_32560 [Nocardiopsis sp. MT53]
MFATEPLTKMLRTADSWDLGNKTGVRNNRRGVSMRGVKKDYHRATRRALRTQNTAELADYLTHGAY